MRCENSPDGGFTLLELMVVLVIAGLMLALLPPVFPAAVASTELKGHTRDFAMALREARSRAIFNDAEQSVVLNLQRPQYRTGKGKPTVLPEGIEMSIETALTTSAASEHKHVLRFYPDGSSSGELITLGNGRRAYALQLNWLTGGITIEERKRDDE